MYVLHYSTSTCENGNLVLILADYNNRNYSDNKNCLIFVLNTFIEIDCFISVGIVFHILITLFLVE